MVAVNTNGTQTVHENHNAFIADVLDAAPADVTVGVLREAIRESRDAGQTLTWNVRPCARRATELQVAASTQPTQRKTVTTTRTVGNRISARARTDALAAAVNALREKLFGKASIPFKSVAKMEAWIVAMVPENWPPAKNEFGHWKSLAYRDLTVEDDTWIGPVDGPLLPASHLDEEREPAASRGRSEGGASVYVSAGTRAEMLADTTREMSHATGFSQAQMVALVLRGSIPRLPAPRATVQYRMPPPAIRDTQTREAFIHGRRVVLDMEECDFTLRVVRKLYARTRRLLGSAKSKEFTDFDDLLLRLVGQRGGPRTAKYWTEIAEQCRRRTGILRRPAALRVAYSRLQKAL